jgi:hypothetical protein
MAWGALIGAATGIAGLFGSSSASRDQARAIQAQYKYDTEYWKYNWGETLADYQWKLDETKIGRQNQESNLAYLEQSAQRQYQYDLAIRDFDYANQMRQYQESERIYGLQLGFNSQASQVAYEAENRKFQEILTGMAFDQQDMLVKMLQEEGQVQAAGVSGRSAGKVLASAMASYGRNQAILAESLVSATKEKKISLRQIDTQKYGADLNAQSRRMLMPLKAPAPMAPLKMPRATLQDPRKPKQPPKPIKGAGASFTTSALSALSSGLSAGMAGYNFGSQFG